MSPQVFRSSPFILALLLALLSTQPVAAAELTLQECITRALDKNFQLQIQSFETANANESLSASQSSYDPSFTLSASKSASQADQPSTSLVGTKNDNFNTRVSVSQKITTGATVNVSSTLIRNETNNSFATLNPAYNADVTLSIKQPLLKNAGSAVNKAAIRRAEIGVTIAEQNYKSNVLQLVRDTEVAYFSLVFAREQLKVRSLSLELAEKLYEENRTKKDTGVATDLDVLQSEVGVATARRAVLLAQQQVRNSQDNLLNIIGQFEFDATLGEVSLPATVKLQPDFQRSYALARANYPDYNSAESTLEQLEISAAAARRNRLPSLDLGGAVGYNTRDSHASDAFDRLPDGDGYAWQVDLSLNIPWGMRSEKAQYQTALNNLQRQKMRLRQIDQNLTVQVRSAVLSVETNLESVTISAQATSLSENQYELEKARFDAGLSTSRRVLEAQDDLETARVAELQSRVNLRSAIAELHRLEGTSLALYNIAIDANTAAVN
ncbi:MAG: transporter [Opitutaceae bacterium]|nr:transporter [Opitutaceae bacterium]